jgi:hypothetical protein
MRAVLEINAATIRVFPPGAEFGDPFEFAVFIVGDEETAVIKGLRADDMRFMSRHRTAIMRCLIEAGFTRAVWHRWKRRSDGLVKRTFTIDTKAESRFVAHTEARPVAEVRAA